MPDVYDDLIEKGWTENGIADALSKAGHSKEEVDLVANEIRRRRTSWSPTQDLIAPVKGLGGSLASLGALGAGAVTTLGSGVASAADALGFEDRANKIRQNVEDYRQEAESLTRGALQATAPSARTSFVGDITGAIPRVAEMALPVRQTFDLADQGVDVQSPTNRAMLGLRSSVGTASIVAPGALGTTMATKALTGAGLGLASTGAEHATLAASSAFDPNNAAAYESQMPGVKDYAISGIAGGVIGAVSPGTPRKINLDDGLAAQRGGEYDAQLANQIQNAPVDWNKDILRQQLAAKSASADLAAGIEKRNADRSYLVDFVKNNPAEFNRFYDNLDDVSRARADELLKGIDLTGQTEAIIKSESDELAARAAEADQIRVLQQEAAKNGEQNADLVARKEEERRILENAGVAVGAAERHRALVDEIYPEEYKSVGPTSSELVARDAMRREKLANEAAKARGDRNTEDILRQQMREAQAARGEVRQAGVDANIDRLRAEQDIASVNEDAAIRSRAVEQRASVRQSDSPSLEATQASRDRVEEGLRMTREQAQQITPEPNVAPEVQDVADMLDAGVSLRDIVNDFNAAGVPASEHIPVIKKAQEIIRKKQVASASTGGIRVPENGKTPKLPGQSDEGLARVRAEGEATNVGPGVADELVPRPAPTEAPRQVEAVTPEVAPVADVTAITTPIVNAEPPVQRTQLQDKLAADRAAIETQRAKEAAIVEQRKAKLAEQRPATTQVEVKDAEPTIKVYKTAAGNYRATSGELPEGATLVTRTQKNAERYDKFVEKEKNNPTTKLRDPNAIRSGKTSLIGDTADAIKRVWDMTSTIRGYVTDTKVGDSIQNIKARVGNVTAAYKYTEDALAKALKKDFAYAKDRIEREFIKPNADAIAELGRKYGFVSDDLATTIEKRGGTYRTVFRPIFDAELGPKHVKELTARNDWASIKKDAIDGLAKDFYNGDKVAAAEHLTKYLESFDSGKNFAGGKIGGPLDPANLKARKDVPVYLEPILGRITDPAQELMFTLRAQNKILADFITRKDIIETGKAQGWATDKPKDYEVGWKKDDRLGVYLNEEARKLLTDIAGKAGAFMKTANWLTSVYNATSITFQGVRQLGLGAGDFGISAITHLPMADVKSYHKYLKVALNQVTPEYRGDVKRIFDIAVKQANLMREGQIAGHNVAAPVDVMLGRDRDILRKAIAKLQTPGTAIDNARRAMMYEIHKDHVKNVFPSKTEAEINAIMRERINNIEVTPANSMKFVRALKVFPGASYVATFMTEKVRNTFNLASYYVQDMRVAPASYKPKIAAKIGMLGLPLFGATLAEQISREAANVTPGEEEKFRMTRNFAQTKSLAFFRDENGNLDAYDIGVVDPISWPRQAAKAMSIIYDKADSGRAVSSDDIVTLAQDAAPFLIHPLIDKVVQASGKLREGDVEGAAKDIGLAFTPGNIRRTAQAEGAVAAAKEFAVGGLVPFTENERRDYATDKLYGGVDMTLASKIRDKKSESKGARKKFYSEIQNRDGTKNPGKLLEASQAFLDETADEWVKTIEQVDAMRKAGDSEDRIRKTLNSQNLTVQEQEAILDGKTPKRPTARTFALKERIKWLEDASERLSAARGAKGTEKAELYKSLQGTDMRGMMDAIRKARLARKIIERYDRIGTDIPNDVYERLISQMQ